MEKKTLSLFASGTIICTAYPRWSTETLIVAVR